ncbi:MAG: PTS sugar transporter subunit IIA [Candidatus Tectomicrobia bacterium]|uniref:PTS sugar transporter subunit IIA n=1 Tax=Tectimicrobiota bacterium TaxID=2528274 RepID=A0A932I1P6_UNCTE|nr:PTS sugar transporter subunit IIA [Candidatus Tectomicrobia bacterium]
MIGLVIVGHGGLPEAMLETASSVLSGATQMRAVCLRPDGDPAFFTEEIERAVREVDSGEGIIVMTDMMGGTPTNAALAMLNRQDVEVVTGVNLPMLLKVPFIKGKTVQEAARFLVEYGRKNLAQPSEMLRSLKREPAQERKES